MKKEYYHTIYYYAARNNKNSKLKQIVLDCRILKIFNLIHIRLATPDT